MTRASKWSLEGKVALVTGGGTGIGKAIALRLSEAGAHVIVAGRSLPPLSAVAREARGSAIAADVSREDDVTRLFASIVERHGRLDVLINNAGVSGPITPIASMDVALWDECIAVNLRGAMLCLKEAARIMTAQRSGSIVNMSSLMGLKGYPMRAAYCATKFALIGVTEAVAREVGPSGVRVNALCPGAVSGELMDRVVARRAAAENKPPEQIIAESYTSAAALQRWVDPEEVAEAALFLASDAGSSVTGDRVKVDAGRF
jgi:NAD(P)-dependent dehydrogenase (short-subunit alcohol dehydrogenase family)